uniref:DUF3299 domain-containing protein n=1 Tax=uncultured verrucomicrobium HF0500_27H16 TaxID=723600 RepID=E7C5J6_9BACT|nr:hypothetical protein [uncultured verrucomicrobium HF0500_27H16]
MNKSLTTLVFGLLVGLSSVAVAGDSKETNDTPAKPVAEESKAAPDGIKALNFKNLAGFKYEYPYEEPKGKPWELKEQFEKRVPEHIRKLNGTQISLKGFMLPVETKKDRVTTFLLMADQSSCCFGKIPEPNEWVVVDMMSKDGGPILMDQLIEIGGKIEVEEKWEEGFFVGIYHLVANTVKKSK